MAICIHTVVLICFSCVIISLADNNRRKESTQMSHFPFLGSVAALFRVSSCHLSLWAILLVYNTLNIAREYVSGKILSKRLMFLRWNWQDKVWEPTYPAVSLRSILSNIFSSPFPPSNADLRNQVMLLDSEELYFDTEAVFFPCVPEEEMLFKKWLVQAWEWEAWVIGSPTLIIHTLWT